MPPPGLSTSACVQKEIKMNGEEIPDSTDWLNTSLPSLEPLEAALRCEVCREFFENPVITTCSHTFCSLCIRRCITHDGKCPNCRSGCQTERLVPNTVVREIVGRYKDAREKVMEVATKKGETKQEVEGAESDLSEGAAKKRGKRKRKLQETDMDADEQESVRQTRSRITRSSSRRGAGNATEGTGAPETPFEVPDSEDEKDAEFLPEGISACPMCNMHMKAELVWDHVEICPGEKKSKTAPSTRSGGISSFSSPRRKAAKPPPPMEKLSEIWYSNLNDAKLRKKLQEWGIRSEGKRELMIQRSQEWRNRWNANLDAPEEERKTKEELLQGLNAWERAHKGNAFITKAPVMSKDYDLQTHAKENKSQFDELIAAARRKAQARASGSKETPVPNGDIDLEQDNSNFSQEGEPGASEPQNPVSTEASRAYNDNHEALATIRHKAQDTNEDGTIQATGVETDTFVLQHGTQPDSAPLGIPNPFASPSRRLPMFAVPEDPVVDVERSSSTS